MAWLGKGPVELHDFPALAPNERFKAGRFQIKATKIKSGNLGDNFFNGCLDGGCAKVLATNERGAPLVIADRLEQDDFAMARDACAIEP